MPIDQGNPLHAVGSLSLLIFIHTRHFLWTFLWILIVNVWMVIVGTYGKNNFSVFAEGQHTAQHSTVGDSVSSFTLCISVSPSPHSSTFPLLSFAINFKSSSCQHTRFVRPPLLTSWLKSTPITGLQAKTSSMNDSSFTHRPLNPNINKMQATGYNQG